jgi:hypothetical protein
LPCQLDNADPLQVRTVVLVIIGDKDPLTDGQPLPGFEAPYIRFEVWKLKSSVPESTVVLHAGATGPIPSLRLSLRDVFWLARFLPVEGLQLDQNVDVPLRGVVTSIVQAHRLKKGLPPTTRFDVSSDPEESASDDEMLEDAFEAVPETAPERAEREARCPFS